MYHPTLLIKMKTSMIPIDLKMNTNYTKAMNMRNEHGQFAINIGATSILDQPFLDDDDVSQDSCDDDDTP